jgi:hypothetical protein
MPSEKDRALEIRERLPIDTGNSAEVRRLLDDVVIRVIDANGRYEENHKWGNIKLVLMTLACAVALFAQFNPWEFPENRMTLAVCCSYYMVSSIVLQVIFVFVDQDFIYVSQPYAVGGGKSAAASSSGRRAVLTMETSFQRFQDRYLATFRVRDESHSNEELEKHCKETMDESVGRWFDGEGNFHELKFQQDVKRHLAEHEKKVSKFYGKKDK